MKRLRETWKDSERLEKTQRDLTISSKFFFLIFWMNDAPLSSWPLRRSGFDGSSWWWGYRQGIQVLHNHLETSLGFAGLFSQHLAFFTNFWHIASFDNLKKEELPNFTIFLRQSLNFKKFFSQMTKTNEKYHLTNNNFEK